MTDYSLDRKWSDTMARVLAALAVIVSVAALIWAIKADNRAGDALNRANQSITTQEAPVSDTPPETQTNVQEPTGVNENGNNPDQADTETPSDQ